MARMCTPAYAAPEVLDGRFLEEQIQQGETYTFLVLVGAEDDELKVTLAWDDPAGTPDVNPVLVNDLDLRIMAPTRRSTSLGHSIRRTPVIRRSRPFATE